MPLVGEVKTTHKIPFDFAPDQPLDGALVATIISGDATIEQTGTDGLHGFVVPGTTAGDTANVEWRGDADPSTGVSELVETGAISIIAPNATTLGGSLGTPVLK